MNFNKLLLTHAILLVSNFKKRGVQNPHQKNGANSEKPYE